METNLFPKMRPNKRAHVQKRTLIFLVAVILVLSVAFGTYYIVMQKRAAKEAAEQAAARAAAEEANRIEQERLEREYQLLLAGNTFFQGISIDGVDISNLTMDEARQKLQGKIDGYMPSGTVIAKHAQDSYPIELSLIRCQLDLDSVLNTAFSLARRGTYAEAQPELDALKAFGRDFPLHAIYDYSGITTRVAEIAAQIDSAAKDASITFEKDEATGRPFSVADESVGVIVRQQELIEAVIHSLDEPTPSLDIPITEVQPKLRRAELENSFQLRAKAETSFKGSDSNRVSNIKKGAKLMDGTVLKPNAVFSANDTLGVRIEKNGWKQAGAYVGGSVEKQAGGGVCQLSSTLYNAIVKADLEVVSRRNHSMPVSYIKNGLDATINSVGNIIDFKFRNNTSADVLIHAYTTGTNLIFEIYGLPFQTADYDEIRLTSEKISTVKPIGDIIETYDETLAPGASEVKVTRQNGSIWQSYKNYYLNGTLVRSEKLAQSTYDAFQGEILIGPPAIHHDSSPDSSDIDDFVEDVYIFN